jgi:hypothetical protein
LIAANKKGEVLEGGPARILHHAKIEGAYGAAEMSITTYLPTSGASFGPEVMASMAKAFEDAVAVIGIGPRDETKREAVARVILLLAEIDRGLDSATLRDKAVMALAMP